MKSAFFLPIALTLFAAAPGLAQPTNQTVFRADNWFVVRSTKPDGAVACTGFYIGQDGVQLNKYSLTVKIPGEVKSVSLRFGDQPVRAPRTLDPNEQQMGAVMLAGPDFEQLRRSKTLGLDVATAQGRESHALKLEGLDATLRNIDAGCPLTAAAARAQRAKQQARAKALAARCAPDAIAKQRANGVPEWRIADKCPKAAPAKR
jgi:hypothetical protein